MQARNLENELDIRVVDRTELILGTRSQPELMESLYMGCVGLSRQYFPDGRITAAHFQEAVNHARQELEPLRRAYTEHGWETALGASGTILAAQEILHNLGHDQGGITANGVEQIRRALVQAKQVSELSLSGLPAIRSSAQRASSTGVCRVSQPRAEFSSRKTASSPRPAWASRAAIGTMRR